MNKINTINGVLMASQDELNKHVENGTAHVTEEERATWNNKADASALSSKVNTATFNIHASDSIKHLTSAEHTQWDHIAQQFTFTHDDGGEAGHPSDSQSLRIESTMWGSSPFVALAQSGDITSYGLHDLSHTTYDGVRTSVAIPALIGHQTDSNAHISPVERENWNAKADAATFKSHKGDTAVHITEKDRQRWNSTPELDTNGNMTLEGVLTTNRVINANGGIRIQHVNAFASNQSSVNKFAAMGLGPLQHYGMEPLFIDPANSKLGDGSKLLPVIVPGQLYRLSTSVSNRAASRAVIQTFPGALSKGSGSGYNQYRGIFIPFRCDRIYTTDTNNPYWIKYTFNYTYGGRATSAGFRDEIDGWDCYITDLNNIQNCPIVEITMMGGDNPSEISTFRVRTLFRQNGSWHMKTTFSKYNNFHKNELSIAGFVIQGTVNGVYDGQAIETGKLWMIRNGISSPHAVALLSTLSMPEAFFGPDKIYINSYCNNNIYIRNPELNFRFNANNSDGNPLYYAFESEEMASGIISETVEDYVVPSYAE